MILYGLRAKNGVVIHPEPHLDTPLPLWRTREEAQRLIDGPDPSHLSGIHVVEFEVRS